MTLKEREVINSKVSSFRQELDISVPINFDTLIKKLNGQIKDNDEIPDAKIAPNDEHFVISINKNISDKRKRFSIAHEIGHLILHMAYDIKERKIISDKQITYDRLGYDKKEQESNEFAAALLMPIDEFKYKADLSTDSDGYCDISKLSDHFKVSPQAAITRGKVLGLF